MGLFTTNANARWPFIPFLAVRGAQIFFAIIVLGLSEDVGNDFNGGDDWSAWFALTTSILTLVLIGGLIFAFLVESFSNFTAPLFTLGIDAFLFLFWIISLGGFANQFTFILSSGCSVDPCGAVKGNTAMIVFEFLLFLASLIWSGWWFWREHSGKNPGVEAGSAGAIGGAPVAQGYPMQQSTPAPAQPYPPPAPEHA